MVNIINILFSLLFINSFVTSFKNPFHPRHNYNSLNMEKKNYSPLGRYYEEYIKRLNEKYNK